MGWEGGEGRGGRGGREGMRGDERGNEMEVRGGNGGEGREWRGGEGMERSYSTLLACQTHSARIHLSELGDGPAVSCQGGDRVE